MVNLDASEQIRGFVGIRVEAAPVLPVARRERVAEAQHAHRAVGHCRATSWETKAPSSNVLGIGKSVPLSDARPGDFVQYWRNTKDPSGHSVVFLDWLTDATGNRIGLKYRSAGFTKGVSDSSEKFSGHGGRIDPNRTFFSRLFDGPAEPRVA